MISRWIDENATLGDEQHCYLMTRGRASGREYTTEIWFALSGKTLFMLSGNRERADWVRNAVKQQRIAIRLGAHVFEADARIVEAEEEGARARHLLRDKYADPNADYPAWMVAALPIAFDLI